MNIPFVTRQAARAFLLCPETLFCVYVLAAVAVSVQSFLIPPHFCGNYEYTDYNNYIIFRQSFAHLIDGKNLYDLYPAEHWDGFKYSPSFAMAMGVARYLPDITGLCAWNLLNALALFAAIWLLPFRKDTRLLVLWFVLPELITCLQNAQSNGLVAGLIIAAFGCMERGKATIATLCIIGAMFIKIYGAVALCLFLFYPGKMKFTFAAIFWTVIICGMPLFVTPPHTLLWQYNNWVHTLLQDHSLNYGLSVMGCLHVWFAISSGKGIVNVIGIALFLLPFTRTKLYCDPLYKSLALASMLIWVVIFSHMAESPTYIIAVSGVGIWYFSRSGHRHTLWRGILLASVFVFTCLSPTDIVPPFVRLNFFVPYSIKAIPCILVWCIIWIEQMTMKKTFTEVGQTSAPLVA